MNGFREKLITKLGIILNLLVSVLSFTEDPSCECGQQKITQAYIINGKVGEPTLNPWLATMYTNEGSYSCGGSIITPKNILTAAHCLYDRDPHEYHIRVGVELQESNNGERYGISSWILHENYRTSEQFRNDNELGRNDIGIINLEGNIRFHSKVWPICLNDQDVNFEGKLAIIAGWGLMYCREDIYLPTNLQTGLMKISSPEECSTVPELYHPTTSLCSLGSNITPYRGDSGSPLVMNTRSGYFVQIGIVSFSYGCYGERSGVFFSKVSTYSDWIHNNTENVESCRVPI